MAIVTGLIDPPDLKNISQIDENSINFFYLNMSVGKRAHKTLIY